MHNKKGILIMGRPKSNNVQINISIPLKWKTQLENLARIYSVEEGETITFLDLMRRGIQEKYQLDEDNPENYIFLNGVDENSAEYINKRLKE